jgi:hypothetical protein
MDDMLKQYFKYDDDGYFVGEVIIKQCGILPENITDVRPIDGMILPKWDGEKWSEGGEMPKRDINETKQEAISKTHMMLADKLEQPFEFNGKPYTVNLKKQNLLLMQLGLYLLNSHVGIKPELMWNVAGEDAVVWEFDDLLLLANEIAAYITPFVKAQRNAEIQIIGAESVEDVCGIIAGFPAQLV